MTRDVLLRRPMPDAEFCRTFHGANCQVCPTRCSDCGAAYTTESREYIAAVEAYDPTPLEIQDADSGGVCVRCGASV